MPSRVDRAISVSKAQKIQQEKLKKASMIPDQLSTAKPKPLPYPPTKPTLIIPEKKSLTPSHYLYRILRFVDRTDQLERALMEMGMEDQNDMIKHLAELMRKQLENSHKAENAAQSSTAWTYLEKVATCIFAVATMSIGFYLTGNPDVSGLISYGMVAAGFGSITAMTLSEMNVWPKFSRLLALGASSLGLVLGGATAFSLVAAELPKLMINVTMLAVNALYGLSTAGRSYRKAQADWHNYKRLGSKQDLRIAQNTIEEIAQRIEMLIKRLEYVLTQAFRILEEQQKQNRQIQRVATAA